MSWRAWTYQCNVLRWVNLVQKSPTIPENLSHWSTKGNISAAEMELKTRTLHGPYLVFLWRLLLDFISLDFLCFFFFFSSSLLSSSLSLSPTQKYFQDVNNSSYTCTPAYGNYRMYSIQQLNSIPFEFQVGFIDNLLVSRRNPTAIIVCTANSIPYDVQDGFIDHLLVRRLNPLTHWSDKHCNFSLKYPYISLHTGNENTQTNQVEVFLIQHQILITNLQEDVLQLKGRINNHILGLKGLRASTCQVGGKSAISSNWQHWMLCIAH